MARYLLIEVPDNAEADAFVKAVQEGYIMYSKPHPSLAGEVSINRPQSEWRVAGMYMSPQQFCECPKQGETVHDFARGSKYGLWVHRPCGRVKKATPQQPRNLLLPAEVDPKERLEHVSFWVGRRAEDLIKTGVKGSPLRQMGKA